MVVVDPAAPVFGLSVSRIGRRVKVAARAAVVELPTLIQTSRWKRSKDADTLHRAPSGRTERGGQALPGTRGLAPGRGRIQTSHQIIPAHLASLFVCGDPFAVGHQSHANETQASVGLLRTCGGQCHSLPLHSL